MLFALSARSRIYLLCPPRVNTGGPHALYQLCHELRRIGHDARLVFADPNVLRSTLARRAPWAPYVEQRQVPLEFPAYDIRQAVSIEDAPDHVLIVPELAPDLLLPFTRLQKAIWWLSTNESPFGTVLAEPAIRHLCQSASALDMARRRGFEYVYPLSDYTTNVPRAMPRRRCVAFNPVKGLEFTKRIIAAAADLEFVPLRGLSGEEMSATLSASMVYIDFGGHPGKDRIPREAAACGCCVIVGRIGSAAIFQDVPLDSRYKVDMREADPAAIAALLRRVLDDYETCTRDFEMYRRAIAREREQFVAEIHTIFGQAPGLA